MIGDDLYGAVGMYLMLTGCVMTFLGICIYMGDIYGGEKIGGRRALWLSVVGVLGVLAGVLIIAVMK